MKKAQSAVEFVLLVSFMLLIFFSFFLSFQNKIVEIAHAQDMQYLQEANDVVISEIQLAQQMYADYERTFDLPSLSDKPYEMHLTAPNEITSYYNGIEYVNFLPINISGDVFSEDIASGNNTIYKTDGVVYLPDGTVYRNPDYAGYFANVNPEICYLFNATAACEGLYDINPQFKQFCMDYFDIVCPFCSDGVVDRPYEDCDNASNNVDCWHGGTFDSNKLACKPNSPEGLLVVCNTSCKIKKINRGCDDGYWCDQFDIDYCEGADDDVANNNDCDGILELSVTNPTINALDVNNFNSLVKASGCSDERDCVINLVKSSVLKEDAWTEIDDNPWGLKFRDGVYSLRIHFDNPVGTETENEAETVCNFDYTKANLTFSVSSDRYSITRNKSFVFSLVDCPSCGDGNLPKNNGKQFDYDDFNGGEPCDIGGFNPAC